MTEVLMNAGELQQAQKLEELKRHLLGRALSKEALERLGRVRTVNPELAGHAELYIINIFQEGKLRSPVSDSQLREVLRVLSEKKEISIRRR